MTRTAKVATVREPARDRILRTATDLFYMYGIRGVGVDRIIAESGVAKATLYAHFKSKDELVLAFLRQADEKWRRMLREAAAAAGDDPREQLIAMFDAIAPSGESGQFRGCVFINSASESLPGTPVHLAAAAHKKSVREWATQLATAAGATDPALLARQLTVLLDGTMSAASLEPASEVVPAARRAARAMVEAACP
ncbi:TetR/AcrR family transcriptional regulator [Actinomadura rudentiformis]|uniref:TetR/AcrR family transcriptional regulator n=1 Tax=Actinomadura rudentiformis TaxID=359158 RepID=A0A6H9YFA9_9ACTN|nr:TetR/AcrR family transcriptional regulator [Actinomadura rudentiformis]KAB2344710.1 TetR/AcrR family transcriptional regulator [Actinomadura rudentiformis]